MEESLNQNRISGEDEEGITTTRIFVGGLGESVTSGDISRTLSSLGTVKAVDIVRTKGRSFAYVDFLPSSEKSLSKLFSMVFSLIRSLFSLLFLSFLFFFEMINDISLINVK